MTDESPFLNSEKFFAKVEELVRVDKYNHIEATIKACDVFGIDPEDVVRLKLINSALRDRLHIDGMQEGFLKRESQLPI